jgi:DNA repair protein RecO (recombination protein O)
MQMERALALVIRGTDFSESSKITTLWSREFGKIRGIAKGGRRLGSAFDSAFDLLTVCSVVFIRKPSTGLDLLTEARIEERFAHLRTDLHALYIGYYLAELLECTQDYDPHPILFESSLQLLRDLASKEVDRPGRVSAFELVWLTELGYSPRLLVCAACEKNLVTEVPIAYSPASGGVICANCSPRVTDRQSLTPVAWQTLKTLEAGETALPSSVRREVRTILGRTVSYVLGRRPRMLSYVDGT